MVLDLILQVNLCRRTLTSVYYVPQVHPDTKLNWPQASSYIKSRKKTRTVYRVSTTIKWFSGVIVFEYPLIHSACTWSFRYCGITCLAWRYRRWAKRDRFLFFFSMFRLKLCFCHQITSSINEVICGGVPDRRKLEEGDIINLGPHQWQIRPKNMSSWCFLTFTRCQCVLSGFFLLATLV